jgi:hypothetical protein
MPYISIMIHVQNYEVSSSYYRNIFELSPEDELFYMPPVGRSVAIRLVEIGSDQSEEFSTRRTFPLFELKVQKNFLSYCANLVAKGVELDGPFEDPGGYYAKVFDPDGNRFDIACDGFEEDALIAQCS